MADFGSRYGPWAVVAGASEGIGAAFCRRIASHGVNVVLVSRRPDALRFLGSEIAAEYGIDTRSVAIDLSVGGAEKEIITATEDLEVGLLVYNAGADDHNTDFLDVPAEAWAAMVQRNCVVPMLATHHYARSMVQRGSGGIILVTSGAAWAGGSGLAVYGATKAFDLIFAEALWSEYRAHGVDALSLVVGPTDTPAFQRVLARHGISRDDLADPDDVAGAGLDHLGDGPTWSMGTPDGGGPSPFASMPRRQAVELMSAGSKATLGQE